MNPYDNYIAYLRNYSEFTTINQIIVDFKPQLQKLQKLIVENEDVISKYNGICKSILSKINKCTLSYESISELIAECNSCIKDLQEIDDKMDYLTAQIFIEEELKEKIFSFQEYCCEELVLGGTQSAIKTLNKLTKQVEIEKQERRAKIKDRKQEVLMWSLIIAAVGGAAYFVFIYWQIIATVLAVLIALWIFSLFSKR